MATPVVTNTAKRPDQSAAPDAVVSIELVGEAGKRIDGYVTASDYTIYGLFKPALNASTAVWSQALVPNSLITPAGSMYKVTTRIDGDVSVDFIVVTDVAGPLFVEDILEDGPPGPLPSNALKAHIDDATDAHDATAVSFAPAGTIASVNVQAAVEEAATEAASALAAHVNDTTDAHDASAVSNVPAGDIAATDVQAALNELDTDKATTGSVSTVAGDLAAHISDTADAHDASAISSVPAGTLAATNVQSALNELDTEKATTGSVSTVAGDLAAHIADATDAHDASAISSVAAGTLAATDVQAALNELDTEKIPKVATQGGTAAAPTSTEVWRFNAPSDDTRGPFNLVVGGALFQSTFDRVMYLGYNVADGGGKAVAAEPKFAFVVESDYDDGSKHVVEAYFEYTKGSGATGPTSNRPIFLQINRATGQMQFEINSTNGIIFGTTDGAQTQWATLSSTGLHITPQTGQSASLSLAWKSGGQNFLQIDNDTNGFILQPFAAGSAIWEFFIGGGAALRMSTATAIFTGGITTGHLIQASAVDGVAFRVQDSGGNGYSLIRFKRTADTQYRFFINDDDVAASLNWGPGGSTAADTTLARTAASVLSLGADDVLKTGAAVTGSRPSASTVGDGAQFYDTTLKQPIWSNGTVWRDAMGNTV